MRLSRRSSLAAFAGLLALAAPVFAQGVTVETARGPAQVPEAPQRLAVFDMAAIDTLIALGRTPDAAPSPLLLERLAAATEGAAAIGTIFEPDFEALAGFAPDLIIAGGRSAAQVDALSGLAPTVDMTMGTDLFADGLARMDAYAAMLHAEPRAAEIRARLIEKRDRAKALAEKAGPALIILTNGTKMSAFGAESRFGWLHGELDWPQAAEVKATGRHGEAISFEYIAAADPSVILVIDRAAAIGQDGAGAMATLDTPLVHGTKAWKTGRVIALDAGEVYLSGGGVGALEAVLDQVIEALSAPAANG